MIRKARVVCATLVAPATAIFPPIPACSLRLRIPSALVSKARKAPIPKKIVAAHAGSFTMALAFQLQGTVYVATELNTEAAVTLEPEGQGFRISRSALTLRAQVPNLDEAAFARMPSDAEKNCPVSKVLNAAITLDAKLI
jgi:OsmC subfamily peroxiredoxin